MNVRERVLALVQPVLEEHGVFAVEVALRGRNKNQVLEVFIDSERALTAEILENVSTGISSTLDRNEVVHGPYRLIVSTPGVDRPLSSPLQYIKNMGRRIRLTYHGTSGNQTVEGTLVTCSGQNIEVLRTATDSPIAVRFEDIVEARILLPW